MSHERSNSAEMDSYLSNKFYPAKPVYVLGRSYKAEPTCKPQEALFDNWMDRSHSHAMTPHCQPCIMPSCVPRSIAHHVCSWEFGKSCQSLPPDRAHACSHGISFWMKHTVECLTEFTDTGPTMYQAFFLQRCIVHHVSRLPFSSFLTAYRLRSASIWAMRGSLYALGVVLIPLSHPESSMYYATLFITFLGLSIMFVFGLVMISQSLPPEMAYASPAVFG